MYLSLSHRHQSLNKADLGRQQSLVLSCDPRVLYPPGAILICGRPLIPLLTVDPYHLPVASLAAQAATSLSSRLSTFRSLPCDPAIPN